MFYAADSSDPTTKVAFTDCSPCGCFAEAHEYGDGNPLLALLLLLGIPAGICCCCRKKIFKKKATNATMLQVERRESMLILQLVEKKSCWGSIFLAPDLLLVHFPSVFAERHTYF